MGLSDFQVEDLITSCPISCGIECNSLIVFGTNITYRLLLVDNFLAPESTALFEEASANYLTKYVLTKNEDSRFSLNRVELLSQRMLEKVGPTRRLVRTLKTSDSHLVDLEISVSFRGFVLDVNISEIETLLHDGIQTFGYMRALRFTNDPALQDVEVALDIGLNETDEPIPAAALNGSKGKNSSPWVITLAILVVMGITVFVAVYLKVLRHTSSMQSEKDYDSPIISPVVSARSTGNIVPNFSYESIVRFAPMNIVQRTETPTSMVDSTGDDSSLKTSPNASMLSTAESGEEEHPLTGIVPSMIVYDCIDGSDDLANINEQESSTEKVKIVVPSRHMAATVSFRKALQENSHELLDKSMFMGISDTFNHTANTDATNHNGNKKISDKVPQPKHLSGSEVTSASDAKTIRTRAGEREPLDISELESHHVCSERRVGNGNASSSSSRRYQSNYNHGRQIIIHAPRVEKLGLVLQSSESHGHVVIQVKAYSPLIGEICPGDRIICIDGQDTTGMSLVKVTKLISKSNDEIRGTGALEVVVWRSDSEMSKLNTGSIEIPSVPMPKVSGHKRSVSGSSTRSATSAPPMGSYRSIDKYHRHIASAHQYRNSSAKITRGERHQNRISSRGSSRSASSTPNPYHHHTHSIGKSKIPPTLSHQRTASRYPDTFIEANRRMLTPPIVPTSRLIIPKTPLLRDPNEC